MTRGGGVRGHRHRENISTHEYVIKTNVNVIKKLLANQRGVG